MDSDDDDRIDCQSCITLRESLIERLKQIVKMSNNVKPKHFSMIARDLVSISKSLGEIGLKCVQRIVGWTIMKAQNMRQTNPDSDLISPPVFKWNNVDYLSKMLNDLDFVVTELPSKLAAHGNFSVADPLFIRKSKSADHSTRRAEIAATLVILDSVARAAARKTRSQETATASAPQLAEEKPQLKTTGSFRKVLNLTRGIDKMINTEAPLVETDEMFTEFQGEAGCYKVLNSLGSNLTAKVFDCERQDGLHCVVKALDLTWSFSGTGLWTPSSTPGEGPLASSSRNQSRIGSRQSSRQSSRLGSWDNQTNVMREVAILKELGKHPNIVEVLEIAVDESEGLVYVVMEKMASSLNQIPIDRLINLQLQHVIEEAVHPSLSASTPSHPHPHTYIHPHSAHGGHGYGHGLSSPPRRRNSLWPLQIQGLAASVLLQILDALAHIHALNIVHSDVRPANILVNPHLTTHGDVPMVSGGYYAKLVDFEMSYHFDPSGEGEEGGEGGGGDRTGEDEMQEPFRFHGHSSLNYRAPERLGSRRKYGPPVDIWALGCSIYELVTGIQYAEGGSDQEVLDSILSHHTLIPYTMHRSLEHRGLQVSAKKTKREMEVDLAIICKPVRNKLESMLELLAQERGSATELREGLDEWVL